MAKQRYTAEQVAQALRDTKGMVTIAAQRLGCNYNTVIAYINRFESCQLAQREAHEQMGDAAELKLYSLAVNDGNPTALIFLLKTQFKRRGYVERSEQINFNVDSDLIKRAIEAIEKQGLEPSEVFNSIIASAAENDRATIGASGAGEGGARTE